MGFFEELEKRFGVRVEVFLDLHDIEVTMDHIIQFLEHFSEFAATVKVPVPIVYVRIIRCRLFGHPLRLASGKPTDCTMTPPDLSNNPCAKM